MGISINVVFAFVLPVFVESQSALQKSVCSLKTESIMCPPGQEISITTVFYGRIPPINLNFCNQYNSPIPSNTNCVGGQTPTTYVKNTCEKKQSCSIKNDWQILGPDPCPGIPKYLQIDYTCVSITTTAATTSTLSTTTTKPTTRQTKPTTRQTTPKTRQTTPSTTQAPSTSMTTLQKSICSLKTESFVCPSGQEISITKVLYGRIPPINVNFCNQYNSPIQPNTNCVGGPAATTYVKNTCEKKQSCSLTNDWQILGPDPCPGIPKYLQVDYKCVSTMTSTITTTGKTTPTTHQTTPTTIPTTTQTTPTTTPTTTQTTPTTTQTPSTSSTPATTPTGGSQQVVCPGLSDRLHCPPGDQIAIDTVLYGRTNALTCNPFHNPISNLNCVSTQKSRSTVELYCNQQSSCIVKADSSWLGEDPCPGTPKYLQVKYHCYPLGPPQTALTTPTTTRTTPTTTSTTPTTTASTTPSTTTTTTSTTTTTPTTTTTTTTPTTTTAIPTTTTTTTPTTTTTTPTTTTTTPTTTTTTTTPTTTTTTPTTTTTTPTTTTTTPTTTTTITPTTTTTSTTPSTSTATITTSTPASTSLSSTTTLSTTQTTVATTFPTFVPFHPPGNLPSGSQVCHEYLVSGPHGVPDSHLTASSQWNSRLPNDNNGPERGRLFTTAHDYGNGSYARGAWSAEYNDKTQFIQVEFTRPSLIRGIVTQGRHVNPLTLCCVQRVTQYKVTWSTDGVKWNVVKDRQGKDVIYAGNNDDDSLVTHMLDCPVIARFVRILPQAWTNHIALRFDVIGCQAIADAGKCPRNWVERPGSDTCYLFSSSSLSWDKARRNCQLQQGHLVDIQSVQEKNFIIQELWKRPNIDMWWIGLTNSPRKDNKDFGWTDGKPHDSLVLPWKTGQPDNGGYGEHCGEFWNKELNDDNCDNKRHYICEKNKFWSVPMNKPNLHTVTPPTVVTTPTTTKSTPSPTYSIPTTVNIHLPTRAGATVVTNKQNIFTTGCVKSLADCQARPQGDYPYCQGCGYYITCASSGVWVRPCPGSLKFDDNTKTCDYRSSTCKGP